MSSKLIKRASRAISYETLEERRLLAGNVTVVENIHLYIRGDAADNQFEIVADGDQLRINGLEGTTINQQDSYLVQSTSVTDGGVAFTGGLRAHLGPGNDNFNVQDSLFESFSVIFGGTGDDSIDVVDSEFLDKVLIQTYDGDDSISSTRSHFEGPVRILTLDGQDSVSMVDSIFAGDSIIVTGNHSDTIDSEGNRHMGDVNLILTFDGADTVHLTNPVVTEQQLGIFMGDGDDTINVDLTNATIDGTVKIGGQAGVDQAPVMVMSKEVAKSVTVGTIERREVFNNDVDIESAVHSFDYNERTRRYAANRVTLDETTRIRGIEWTGVYEYNELPRDEVFTIQIFDDGFYDVEYLGQFNAPVGEALATFNVGNDFGSDVNRIDTGEVLENGANNGVDQTIFSYSADIDFELEAGKTYWISIYGGISQQDSDYVLALWQWGFEHSFRDEILGPERGDGAMFTTGRNNEGEWVDQWAPLRGKLDLTLRT